ncbi:MAG: ImmA/IrrE family metallo-endopeptidase [Sphingomonas sp.]|nr:ImmA/IrrE family metallo-endopeptidase [Sphingomonas sp.]
MPTVFRVRYSKIRSDVDRLLSKYGVGTAPVPVEKIARGEGLKIVKQPLDGEVSGFLLRSKGTFFIGVNQGQAKTRQRFTIAHELGHALLHEGEELHVDRGFRINYRDSTSSLATEIEEIESNTFAAWLLMPVQILAPQVRSEHLDFDDEEAVVSLARRYDVSRQAMTHRLANLAATGL